MNEETVVLCFTGSFGSGCSEFAQRCASMYNFKHLKLSSYLREKAGTNSNRSKLQDIGDELRKNKGNSILAKIAFEKAESDYKDIPRLIFDGIRHVEEISFFRHKYERCYLISVDAPVKQRWQRVKSEYEANSLTEVDFHNDDSRDKEESDLPYGQQVRKCTTLSDIMLDNSDSDTKEHNIDRLMEYMGLILGTIPFKKPTLDELHMNHAFLVSHMSSCLQRQVGSVIADKENCLVASGFNDVPGSITPCRDYAEANKKCFRRYMRTCPNCGNYQKPGRVCSQCGELLQFYEASAKDLDLCRAVHAEENAILQAANRPSVSLRGCTLYTTLFPCLLCSKKIINTGIARTVYVDPYPVQESWNMLNDAGVKLSRYSGTTPSGFIRLYGGLGKEY